MANVIIINGVRIEVEGEDVMIRNGKVYVDGSLIHTEPAGITKIQWEGDLASLEADGSVSCKNVQGDVDAGGSVNCENVEGDVDAGGSVNCGNVGGSIDAGGSVSCKR